MDKPFLNAYSRLLIKTCHKRGAFAMGGMAAFIPSKDEERNNQVLNKVKADKALEANNGHDGTWIAYPGLADTAMAVFNDILGSRKNQLEVLREQDAPITADQLLAPCDGERTEEGMRANIRVAVQYIEAWISGNGCVPIYGRWKMRRRLKFPVPRSGSGSIIKNVEQWQTGDQSLVPPDAGRRDESHCQRTGLRTFLPGPF